MPRALKPKRGRRPDCAEREASAGVGGCALPGVSIIIPARGETAALPAALASTLAQDYAGAVEIIIADGSEGPDMAAMVRARFPGARLVSNPDRHIPGGLNRAVAAATHPVIVRCDAHCELPPDYVRRAVAVLERTGAANVGGRQRPAGDTPFTRAVALAMISPLGAGDARYRLGGPEGPADTVFLGVFRRAALEAAGGFNESLHRNEDYEMNWRLRARGETVWFDPALVVRYRPRESPGALARQYFANGWWKRIMLGRHPRSCRWRQLAAPALLLGLAASLALAAAGAPLAGAALPGAYGLALAFCAALAAGRGGGAAALRCRWCSPPCISPGRADSGRRRSRPKMPAMTRPARPLQPGRAAAATRPHAPAAR